MSKDHERPWAWIDVETTGLDERTGAMLEVGIVVTDHALHEIARQSWTVQFWGTVTPEIAAMHTASGLLTQAGAFSDGSAVYRCDGLPLREVERDAVDWLWTHCDDVAPLWCGRNVSFDRAWIRHHLPRLAAAFHHRSVDETTLRIAAQAWGGLAFPRLTHGTQHRALDDLDESIEVVRRVRTLLSALGSP
jgi:oligoribonuclease